MQKKQFPFQPEQIKVLNSEGKNVIVSASAGSGKTTVLIQKLIKLITEKNVSVKKLLVLTYTKASAEEMKQKLIDALYENAIDNPKLLEQIDDVAVSDISTIHSFFQRLIKRYFMVLKINPAFSVMEEQESEILKSQAIKNILNDFSKTNPYYLEKLLDYYGKTRSHKTIKKLLDKINIFLGAVDDVEEFYNHTSTLFCCENLNKNLAVFFVNKELCEMIDYFKTEFLKLNKEAQFIDSKEYFEYTNKILAILSQIKMTTKEKVYFKNYLENLNDNVDNNDEVDEIPSTTFFKNYQILISSKFPNLNQPKSNSKVCQHQSQNNVLKNGLQDNLKGNLPDNSQDKVKNELKDRLKDDNCQEEFDKNLNLYIKLNEVKTKFAKEKTNYLDCDYNEENVLESIKDIKETIKILLELNQSYEKEYLKLKQRKNVVDFNDLEKYALLLLKNSSICSELQNQYKYIFVDEYQDANYLQEKILSLISSNNNRFMVGDVKQSIYGFRQAEPDIFLNLEEKFKTDPNSEALTLNSNFRSNKNILNFVNLVFSEIMTQKTAKLDYKISSCLRPKAKYKDVLSNSFKNVELNIIKIPENIEKPKPPKIYSVQNIKSEYLYNFEPAELEARLVAKKISELVGQKIYDAKLKQEREIQFKDICMLLNSRGEYLDKFCSVLNKFGIPIYANTNSSLFEDEEIKIFLSLLKLSVSQLDDISYVTVLHSIFGELTYNEIAILKIIFPKCNSVYEIINKFLNDQNIIKFLNCFSDGENCKETFEKDLNSFATNLKETLSNNNFSVIELKKLYQKVKNFTKFLDNFIKKLKFNGVYLTLNKIINDFDYFSYLYQRSDGIEKVAKIKKFVENFVNNSYNFDIVGFLNFVENSPNLVRAPNYISGDNCVSITTIHSSKGLEYPIVFLINCGGNFYGKQRDGDIELNTNFGIALKRFDKNNRSKNMSIIFDAMQKINKNDVFAEKLRLLYVALTRAQNHLFIVGSTKKFFKKLYSNFQIKSCSSFLDLIIGSLSEKEILEINNFFLLQSNKSCIFNNLKNYSTNCYFAENFIDNVNNVKTKAVGKFDIGIVDYLKSYFNKDLPQKTNVALKNSVTSLSSVDDEFYTSYNPQPKLLKIEEHNVKKINEIGTDYHEILEIIPFDEIHTCLDVENFIIKNNLNKTLDVKKIFECIKLIKSFQYKNILKEQKFMMYVPHKDIIENGSREKILIQGVIDLVLLGKKNVLIDYKYTLTKNRETLINRYKMQLKLYKKAVEESLNISINEVYLLLIYSAELVKVDL